VGVLTVVCRRAIVGPVAVALLVALCGPAVWSIETDQYYAWGRDLEDSTEMINAKVTAELNAGLVELNASRSWEPKDCEWVTKKLVARFRMFIYHELELWVNNTSLVDRVPATAEEELQYREEYIYHADHPLNPGTWIPPSPTIEVDGVRFGTDKFTHFFSQGWMLYRWYRKALEQGMSRAEAELRAIDGGIRLEQTVLGKGVSGVLSIGDLEANHQGMRWMIGMCEGDDPGLTRTDEGWELSRPFDFREYVSPEWDESYQSSIYTRSRGKTVRPVLEEYCGKLDSPAVQERRARYAAQDRVTLTEMRLAEWIAKGKLKDPHRFSVERVCAELAAELQAQNAGQRASTLPASTSANPSGPLDD
jgi:hypothetical protein